MPELEIDSTDALLDAISALREEFRRGNKISISWKSEGSYTPTQRASLHRWFEMLADVLNSGGFDQTVFFKEYARPGMKAPWSKESVKQIFYKPVLEAMTGKRSTEEMNTVEPSEICTIIGASLADRLGITPPAWPSRFNQ